jgi:hypothetical protein
MKKSKNKLLKMKHIKKIDEMIVGTEMYPNQAEFNVPEFTDEQMKFIVDALSALMPNSKEKLRKLSTEKMWKVMLKSLHGELHNLSHLQNNVKFEGVDYDVTTFTESGDFIPVVATQNDEGDWFIIPSELAEEFSTMLDKLIDNDYEEDLLYKFENKFNQYQTGGDLNNTQLYVKK